MLNKVLLTGAGGFSGKYLREFLVGRGIEVHSMGQRVPQTDALRRYHHLIDITSTSEINHVLKNFQPDYLIHLAGVVRHTDPQVFYRVNTQYAVAILTALERHEPHIPSLFVGTAAEYGQPRPEDLPLKEDVICKPLDHYGISKYAQTLEVLAAHKRSGLPVVIARPSNIVGAGMPAHFVVQSFASQIAKIRRGEQPPILKTGNLQSSRDFISIAEVCKIYWDLIQTPAAYGEVVNVCSGIATPISNLVTRLIELSGLEISVETDPALYRAVDVPIHYGSTEKLRRILGYTPSLLLQETLTEILETS